ncbi:hypothetical protein [Paraliomyxa miuraensis]|uniref:hypothetical protein n=1 Tax=Paraliomyxa miuraensis TaxID=376150 RepID=UPI002257375A|nr:hypothetical protein [Paraliomyxa miuraensis]MCX4242724.1 hypothetical protein [Paraliomyxa miuraensis]
MSRSSHAQPSSPGGQPGPVLLLLSTTPLLLSLEVASLLPAVVSTAVVSIAVGSGPVELELDPSLSSVVPIPPVLGLHAATAKQAKIP